MPRISGVNADLVTVVDTSAIHDLGTEWIMDEHEAKEVISEAAGEYIWVYVYNDSGGTLLQGEVLTFKDSTIDYHVKEAPASTATAALVGVAQWSIANSSYGWILRRGVGEVLADTGGISANTALVVGNAVPGRADDVAATTDHAFAFAHEAATATNLATCSIRIP